MAKKKVRIQVKVPTPPAVYNEDWGLLNQQDLELIPDLGFCEEALVYKAGAEKHGAESWREGIPWSRCVIKLQRHLGKFLAGESRCGQDGQHHLASVKFWCNALMEYEQTHPELDDVRPK